MLSKKMLKALNDQINAELYAAYLYLSMSNYCFSLNLDGFAHWLKVQAQEEVGHAMKIYGYVQDRNSAVTLSAVEGPPAKWASPLNAFEDAYKHEQKVTKMIDNLVNLAVGEQDHATHVFLHWFVDEQVEEEAAALAVVDKLKMIGGAPGGLFMLDRELGARKEE